MIEWLFGDGSSDIRYTLADILHHPTVQERFSHIIIDAPPRLTTASVQALCASTHLIVPTILDGLSSDAVRTFLREVRKLQKGGICPHIKLAGVVGYKPRPQATKQFERQVNDAEERVLDALKVLNLDKKLYIEEAVLQHQQLLADVAGASIGYAQNSSGVQVSNVRQMYDNLAVEIEKRL